ncbi:MAG: hypothetical protein KJ709_00360 [Nanoarchaeota archaeon]|nr:hypothetical protein [Nanoarchaeota archaeon]
MQETEVREALGQVISSIQGIPEINLRGVLTMLEESIPALKSPTQETATPDLYQRVLEYYRRQEEILRSNPGSAENRLGAIQELQRLQGYDS